VLRSKIKPLL